MNWHNTLVHQGHGFVNRHFATLHVDDLVLGINQDGDVLIPSDVQDFDEGESLPENRLSFERVDESDDEVDDDSVNESGEHLFEESIYEHDESIQDELSPFFADVRY